MKSKKKRKPKKKPKPKAKKMSKKELQKWIKNVRLAQDLVEAVELAFNVGIEFKNAADQPLGDAMAVLSAFRDDGRVFVKKPNDDFDEWILKDFENPKP